MECAWEREKENEKEGGNAEVASQPCLTSSLHTHTRAHTAKKAAKAESELECLAAEDGKEEEGI